MAEKVSIPENEYQAAYQGMAFYHYPEIGWLTLEGPDRLDFLHRQSTQELRTVSPEHAAVTVLTSPTARIIDVLWVLSDSERLVLLTLPGHGEKTAAFLKSKIFFIDKVSVGDGSDQYAQIDLIGLKAEASLASLSVKSLPRAGGVTQLDFDGIHLTVLGLEKWLTHTAYRLCFASTAISSISQILEQQGAIQIGEATRDILRIESGVPGESKELTEEYTPLEVGLSYAISDSKGCYTGQEVIARQIAYDKITRNLVGVQLSDWADAGSELRADGRSVGVLTSAGVSPTFGYIGLAVVRRSHAAEGTSLEVRDSVKAIVGPLPFVK